MSLKVKALVAAHDAGGAEVLASWIQANKGAYDYSYCLLGPAVSIFKRYLREIKILEESEAIEIMNSFGTFLSSTSWQNKLELRLLKVAKLNRLETKVFLDHWTNYRERFEDQDSCWKENLPVEICCGDEYSLKICQDLDFPPEKLNLVPNLTFQNVLLELKQLRQTTYQNSLIYFCEPVVPEDENGRFGYSDEYAIRIFFEYLIKQNIRPSVIMFRLHPSEPRSKYAQLFSEYSGQFSIAVSVNSHFLEDCFSYETVAGRESMALVYAVKLHKKVLSIIPKIGPDCVLPFDEIRKIKL